MNKSLSLLAASMLVAVSGAFAGGDHGSHGAADLVDGEVRKVDAENKKITVKHGEIKSLDMPGMTMVFQVKDPAMLSQVKPGDKIKFTAEKSGGAIVITKMEAAK